MIAIYSALLNVPGVAFPGSHQGEGPEIACCVRSVWGPRGRRIEKEAWRVVLKTGQAPPRRRNFYKMGQFFEVEGVGMGMRRNTLKGKKSLG